MNICVYGASSENIDKTYFEISEELGRKLAKRGHGLVFGGGAQGLMGAVSKGALSENGPMVLGVAPKFFDVPGILEKKCTDFIFTENMRQRKQIMEERADGFIVLPGGIGTLEEFFEILTLKQLGRHNKPIGILNINGYYDDILAMINKAAEERFMKEQCLQIFKVEEDVDLLLNYMENPDHIDVRHLKNI